MSDDASSPERRCRWLEWFPEMFVDIEQDITDRVTKSVTDRVTESVTKSVTEKFTNAWRQLLSDSLRIKYGDAAQDVISDLSCITDYETLASLTQTAFLSPLEEVQAAVKAYLNSNPATDVRSQD